MTKWRAPKKTNKKAWKLIEAGDIWWDKRAIRRKLRKTFFNTNEPKQRQRAHDPIEKYKVFLSLGVEKYIQQLSRKRKKYFQSIIKNKIPDGPIRSLERYGTRYFKKEKDGYCIYEWPEVIKVVICDDKIYLTEVVKWDYDC